MRNIRKNYTSNKDLTTLEGAFDLLTEAVVVMFFLSLRFIAYPFLLIGAAVEKNREKQGKIKRKTMKVWCEAKCFDHEWWERDDTEHEIEIPGFFTQMVDLNWQETRHKEACPGYAQRSWEKKGYRHEPRWGCEVPKIGDD